MGVARCWFVGVAVVVGVVVVGAVCVVVVVGGGGCGVLVCLLIGWFGWRVGCCGCLLRRGACLLIGVCCLPLAA